MLCLMSFSPLSLKSGVGETGVFQSLFLSTSEQVGIFAWSLNHADKASLETFWYTQFWNLKHLSLTIVLFFFLLFAVIFANFFLYSINPVIKAKYTVLEWKVPWPMSTISETYNCAHSILELADILLYVYFTTNMKRNYLLVKMLNKIWLKSYQSTYDLRKSQNSMKF